MEIGKLIKTYIKIRDERSTLKAEYSEKDSKLMSQLDKIKEAINEYSEVNSLESARTSEGSFYRSSKTRYWTSDWDSMYKFVLDNKVPEFFDKRLNQKHVREFLEENPDKLPEGLNTDTEYVITVRKAKNE
jgi:hypothetical protein|tara:strand:+ start:1715 stop:2107 length:393 start_codon:yes stop_codon:yes gene_type:complete